MKANTLEFPEHLKNALEFDETNINFSELKNTYLNKTGDISFSVPIGLGELKFRIICLHEEKYSEESVKVVYRGNYASRVAHIGNGAKIKEYIVATAQLLTNLRIEVEQIGTVFKGSLRYQSAKFTPSLAAPTREERGIGITRELDLLSTFILENNISATAVEIQYARMTQENKVGE
jgi:hypothetical protein